MPRLEFGKQNYLAAVFPDTEWTYSYSAAELEKELNSLFAGHVLRALYVDLDGYLESLQREKDFIDLSYMGGTIILAFDKRVLQLAIHAEGMIQYRHFPIWEMKLLKVYDYPPDDMVMSDKYFYNAADLDVSYDYSDKTVHSITVKGTDTWPFYQPGFDESLAEIATEKNDLPSGINLCTDSCTIRIYGSDLEYSMISFDSPGTC